MKKRVILRADANTQIATGHVFRLLALAEMVKSDFEIWFCTNTTDQQLLNTISGYVNKVVFIDHNFEYCLPSEKELNAEIPFDLEDIIAQNDIVVADGYWFREKYQKAVKKKGAKLIMIDDFADQHFYADAVINHAPGVTVAAYNGEPYTKFYLGLNFALIRKTFFKPIKNKQYSKTFFVSFGGSDSYGLSLNFVQSLLVDEHKQIHVLTSKLFDSKLLNTLMELEAKHTKNLHLHQNLNAIQLQELLDCCAYAIVPSSTILFECLARGLKCVTGFYTPNQQLIYSGFIQERLAIGIGDLLHYNTNSIDTSISEADKLNIHHISINSTTNIKKIIDSLC